jgi:hypothetical protein
VKRVAHCLVVMVALAGICSAEGSQFVIDETRPYVYIEMDHVGPRKPLRQGEPTVGLWLRIVNNCRIPIKIPTFGVTSGDSGVGVLHDVVPFAAARTEADDEIIPTTEAAPRQKGAPPEGYSADVYSMTTIAPGKSVRFSVPIDHVTERWFLRVRFVLAVGKPSIGNQPNSYVDFTKR